MERPRMSLFGLLVQVYTAVSGGTDTADISLSAPAVWFIAKRQAMATAPVTNVFFLWRAHA